MLAERVLRITGNEDHLHLRVDLSHFADQPGPIHARHYDVGDQQIDPLFRIPDQIERGLATFSLYDFVALIAQCAGTKDPHGIVILDEHDRTLPRQVLYHDGLRSIGLGGQPPVRRLVERQVNLKSRTAAGITVYEYETACLLDDTVDRRQAEARSRTELFRRKEGVEDASQVVLGNADPRICHLDQHIIASRHRL